MSPDLECDQKPPLMRGKHLDQVELEPAYVGGIFKPDLLEIYTEAVTYVG